MKGGEQAVGGTDAGTVRETEPAGLLHPAQKVARRVRLHPRAARTTKPRTTGRWVLVVQCIFSST